MDIPFKQATCYTKGRLFGLLKPSFLVMHWAAGTLEGTDATFTNPNLGRDPHLGIARSAHYGVGPSSVHQYVQDTDTAWQAGNWWANLRSLGIEHQGAPWLAIDDGTYENSAQLLAQLSRKWSIALTYTGDDKGSVRPHKLYNKTTECPGTLDIARIVKRANELLAPPSVDQVTAPAISEANVTPPAPSETWPKTIRVTQACYVRSAPDQHSPLAGSQHLTVGNTFEAVEVVTGTDPYGDNRNQWYKSSKGNFVWGGACVST